MGYDMNSLAAAWSWKCPVYRYRIADPAPDWALNARTGDDWLYPWARQPGGVLIAEGIDAPRDVVPSRTYDPTEEIEELLAAATSLDATDDEDLLRFVNRWGLLTLAPGPQEGLLDSVYQTRQHLATIRRLVDRLDALKRNRWRALPSLTEIRRHLPGVPRSPSPRERQRIQWQAFAQDLNAEIGRLPVLLRPVLVPDQGVPGVRQTWQPGRLIDVLLVSLWQNATAADLVPRRCGTCTGLFFVSVTNKKRLYCSPRCKNLAGVRRWRRQTRTNRKKV